MILSEEQQHNYVVFNVTYEQTVLKILKRRPRIRRKLEELKEKTLLTGNEYAFGVCSDGRITKMIEGTNDSVNVNEIISICDNKVDLHVHSHPLTKKGSLDYPSEADWLADLWIQTKLASCIYDADNDKINCYKTPKELRDKYVPLINKIIDEHYSEYISYKYSTNELDKKYHEKMYQAKKEEYNKIANEAIKDIISHIYPEYALTDIAYPYARRYDTYSLLVENHPRWGNYNGVWLTQYNFEDLYIKKE